MLIQGSSNTNIKSLTAKKYIELDEMGISADEILTIVLNPYKKSELINEIISLDKKYKSKKLNIMTFSGVCYNAFKDNWGYISELIDAKDTVNPNLCGLEVSQYIFKKCIREADFSDYICKINLLHQLFRRYSLIVNNCLTQEEVKNRSKTAGETFYTEAQKAIENYKLKTNEYRSFDYLRQLAVLPLICKNTDYFKKVKYLLVNDADEYSYAFWQFIYNIMPDLKDYFITYDKEGSTRCGYLCAYKSGIKDFTDKYNPKIIELKDKTPFYPMAQRFYNAITNSEKINSESLKIKNSIKRFDMLKEVINDVESLLKSGVKPSEIAVITPLTDDILMREFSLNPFGIEFQFIIGNQKLIEDNNIKNILIILKLVHGIELKDYELKGLMINFLRIPFKKCIKIFKYYADKKELPEIKFEEEDNDYKYNKLISVIKALKSCKNSIEYEISSIHTNLVEQNNEAGRLKYEFWLKEAKNFESAFKSDLGDLAQEFIIQTENSIISENPSDVIKLEGNKIIVSTPQKVIDYSLRTNYKLFLDISYSEWMKQDTGTLYNSWVLNRDNDLKEFTSDDNLRLTKDKTGRIMRKLILLADKGISFYSSIYDNLGNENFGGISDYFQIENNNKAEFNITARDDQKPVLNYKKGKMGIMAVPGAGKTTILLALIIKLIKEGVNAENIFVLTYMESAAKNFKEKLKNILPDSSSLPNISTIHGLALRIIKENGSYINLGLDDNFDIIDDNQKEKIIKELFFKLKIDDDKFENYLRCISIVKLSLNEKEVTTKYKDIKEFYNFIDEYNKVLKQNNLIDYDDMLCYALKILKENKNILKYYQNICKYIIEDEAQDSTEIQQILIGMLAGKYNNYVRCGDINQAITSTFTDSNLKGFYDFIKNNKKVEMITSQRCSKPIYSLANKLIKVSKSNPEQKNAFYDIQIKGTQYNPVTDLKPQYLFFENESEEKNFILQKIRLIQKEEPSSSIAVLMRLNFQVNDFNEFLLNNNIKTEIRTDCISQKIIFRIIFSVLKIIVNPLNNKYLTELMNLYIENNIYSFDETDYEYIKNLKEPFINIDADKIESEGLIQLYWDIDYWLNKSSEPMDLLSFDIGNYYSKNNTDKTNTGIIVSLIRKLMSETTKADDLLKQLEYYSQKPTGNYKFFEDEAIRENSVKIMTMHKSKGDEFDYVFCPSMNQENYPSCIKYSKIKNGTHFIQTIKNVQTLSEIKPMEELKKEQTEETLRLIYVGITRAKKGLYLSNAKNYLRRKNTVNVDILEKLLL